MSAAPTPAPEPVVIAGALTAFGGSIVGLVQILADWSAAVSGAVTLVWTTTSALIGVLLVRRRVTPNASVAQAAQDAAHDILVELGKHKA